MRSKVLYIVLLLAGFSCRKEELPLIHPVIQRESTDINVKDFGAMGNGVTDDTQAFNHAMRKADSLHARLFIPIGRYLVNLKLSYDNLSITGEQQSSDDFSNGTVIMGSINCNQKKNTSISHLGIDARGRLKPTDDAALQSGTDADSVRLTQSFSHISLVGDGYADYKHGILCQSGSGITIKNIRLFNFYHGIAIRSSHVKIDSVYASSCGFTSVVVKSGDRLNAHTEDVSIDHITITGNPSNPYQMGGTVMVMSAENISRTNNISISNINSWHGGYSCISIQELKGTVENISVNNCISDAQGDNSSRACYDIMGGKNISFNNCSSFNAKGYGFRSTASSSNNIKVSNSFESKSRKGAWVGTFSYLQLNGKEIIK
eukprot:Opistho-2@56506